MSFPVLETQFIYYHQRQTSLEYTFFINIYSNSELITIYLFPNLHFSFFK